VDLGFQPPSNAYRSIDQLNNEETLFPLRTNVCEECFLVQTEDYTARETFFDDNYAYFSSTSKSWLEHAKSFSEKVIKEFQLDEESFVIEVASNDGYLLRNFLERKIPCLGIEPTKNTASQAISRGINTLKDFYGADLAKFIRKESGEADLIICNNVYAHVPDINDFTRAIEISLSENGVVSVEFPHLLNLIKFCQFDTIYHEHFSYLSVKTVKRIFEENNLRIFRVEEIPTHGGSVRIFGCKSNGKHETCRSVDEIIVKETKYGLFNLETFKNFEARVRLRRDKLVNFLINAKSEGKVTCGYGAAAKGNTFLNYAGIKSDLLPFVADAAKAKVGKFLPGSGIPIKDPSAVNRLRPDYIIILPWNIADEVKMQFSFLADLGTKFFTFIPDLKEI
jgi:SAM-dependent methyltransferase